MAKTAQLEEFDEALYKVQVCGIPPTYPGNGNGNAMAKLLLLLLCLITPITPFSSLRPQFLLFQCIKQTQGQGSIPVKSTAAGAAAAAAEGEGETKEKEKREHDPNSDFYLIATSEQPISALHQDEVRAI